MTFTVDIIGPQRLRTLDAEQWDALSHNALDPSPCYARHVVLSGLDTIDRAAQLRGVVIYRNGVLVGLFPAARKLLSLTGVKAAQNKYQFGSQPLIHREHAGGVVDAWLQAIESGKIPRRWAFVNLDLSSRFLDLYRIHSANRSMIAIPSRTYRRMRLKRTVNSFTEYLETTVSRRRVKDIQRTLRRLGEIGSVTFERVTEPQLVAQCIDEFLELEHKGWKGQVGTSLLSQSSDAEFARRAFRSAGATSVSVDCLRLDGVAVAMSVNVQQGRTMFTPKCAYDEDYRRFSPGLVLEYLVIKAFFENPDIDAMDSATTECGHLIEGLWNVPVQMGTMLIGPDNWITRALGALDKGSIVLRSKTKCALAGSKLHHVLIAARSRLRALRAA